MKATPCGARRAFSLVELLVVIGIVTLLLSILLPALNKAREAANTIKCLSNLRQLAQANSMYAAQWRGWAVPGLIGNNNTPGNRVFWTGNNVWRGNVGIPEWAGGGSQNDRVPDGLLCPSASQPPPDVDRAGGEIGRSYGYNVRHLNYAPKGIVVTLPVASTWNANTEFAGVKANQVRNPAQKIQFMDAMTMFVEPQHSNHYLRVERFDDYDEGGPLIPGGAVCCAYRHSRDRAGDGARINIVFWDGHAATLRRGNVAAVLMPHHADPDGPAANRTPAWDRHWELGID